MVTHRVVYSDNSEHLALLFSVFSCGVIILFYALRAQRKRLYNDGMFKQRLLVAQFFDMYVIRTESLRIRRRQLATHRYVLKHGKVIE